MKRSFTLVVYEISSLLIKFGQSSEKYDHDYNNEKSI